MGERKIYRRKNQRWTLKKKVYVQLLLQGKQVIPERREYEKL